MLIVMFTRMEQKSEDIKNTWMRRLKIRKSSFSAITKDMCSIGFESFEKCFKEQMDKQNERKSKLEVFASGAGDESEARKNWNSTEGEFV